MLVSDITFSSRKWEVALLTAIPLFIPLALFHYTTLTIQRGLRISIYKIRTKYVHIPNLADEGGKCNLLPID